jgi:hypothetical protein
METKPVEKVKRIAQERVTCYIPRHKYNKLASKLKLEGLSVSEWFRQQADQELQKKKTRV